MNISEYIPIGRSNAVTRKQLSYVTGLGDRQVREAIEYARSEGAVILSSSHHPGYWMADEIDDIKQYVQEMRSRIRKLEIAKESAEKAIGEWVRSNV